MKTVTYGSVPKQSKRLGISTATYYREMHKGNLPAGRKIGNRRTIADHLIDEIMLGGDEDEE
tara:strand:- start:264 stop:449 length:186 start_codon:yes stop_codon:yes gene_type:complete